MENQFFSLENLPNEILIKIVSHTSPEALSSTKLINRKFKNITMDDIFWKAKFKLHFPQLYQQEKSTDDLKWHDKFLSKYTAQYKGLSSTIKKLFSIGKEGSVELFEEHVLKNSVENNTENSWIRDIASVDMNAISILEWIRINQHQTLLDCIYNRITKLDADSLIKIDDKTSISPRSILWFVLCRQSADKLDAVIETTKSTLGDAWINGYQVIHFATENGNIEIIEKLLAYGANINIDCTTQIEHFIKSLPQEKNLYSINHLDTKTPLQIALINKHIEIAKLLLKRIDMTTESSDILLHLAIYYGCAVIVEELLTNYDSDIDYIGHYGGIPIHTAVEKGFLDIVTILLKHGADVNIFNKDGQRALHLAVRHNRYKIIEKLLEYGADINIDAVYSGTPLHYALFSKTTTLETIRILLKANADINLVKRNGDSILHSIALNKNIKAEILDELLQKYKDKISRMVNSPNVEGLTPLKIAMRDSNVQMLNFLLKLGINANSVLTSFGQTLLHIAVYIEHSEITDLLLANNADVDSVDEEGKTPLHYILDKFVWEKLTDKALEIINKLIVIYKANVNISDHQGKTPLHIAIQANSPAVVKILLENGANIYITDKEAKKPIDIAKVYRNTTIINLINIQSLDNYLKNLSLRSDTHRNSIFGYTAGDKRKAAEALKNVVCNKQDPACLESHKKVLTDGKLKNIYINLLPMSHLGLECPNALSFNNIR